jgi:tetratricopeptide (TPR) repeat protein
VLFLVCGAGYSTAGPPLSDPVREADDYYLGRENVNCARRGLALLRQAGAANPREYEAWWRISKFGCYLGRHVSGPEKLKFLDEAVDAGKRAVGLDSGRVEGHFWLGAAYGLLAEERSLLTGLRLVDPIRSEMEAVVRLDSDYEQRAGLRTLARVYYRAPFFKGGDKRRSIQLLQECLKRFPENSLTMLYLADGYLAVHRTNDARRQLENILALCPDPVYGPELADNQREARHRLAKYFCK